MKRGLLISLLVCSLFRFSHAQLWETGIMTGVSNFLGEMGGDANIGQNGLKDIQYPLTKPGIGAFIRFQTPNYIAVRANFIYGEIAGDDRLSSNWARHYRNFHFKSHVLEFSLLSEMLLVKKDVSILLHPFKGKRKKSNYEGRLGYKLRYLYIYSFIGAGIFHFNPKTEYEGQWYALQPLGTEGQGMPEYGIKKYSLFQLCIPMGGAIQYTLNRRIRIGAELGWRYTLTDYLDDVSGTYADPAIIEKNTGPIAAKLSSRTWELSEDKAVLIYFEPGQRRGDSSDKDSYLFTFITLTYTINPPIRNRPKYERTR